MELSKLQLNNMNRCDTKPYYVPSDRIHTFDPSAFYPSVTVNIKPYHIANIQQEQICFIKIFCFLSSANLSFDIKGTSLCI